MKKAWLEYCMKMAVTPADFFSGARKIITGQMFEYCPSEEDPIDALSISDSGYTNNKLSMLRRLYYDYDHTDAVAALWAGRLQRGKYGSVSVSTYHHLTKSDPEKRSKRASVMGPCLTGVSLTLLNNRSTAVDCFYRTTELFKKFPADLVFLRDVILPHFSIVQLQRIRFHFANVTCHPMYFVTLAPLFETTVEMTEALEEIKAADERMYNWTVKWTARFICDEYSRGIQKFAQALRVAKDARERIRPKRLDVLRAYVRANHPGYRGDYVEEEAEDE